MKVIKHYNNLNNVTEITTIDGNKVTIINYFLNTRGCYIKMNSKIYTYDKYILYKQNCCKKLKNAELWHNMILDL